jgi:hypothetical protein
MADLKQSLLKKRSAGDEEPFIDTTLPSKVSSNPTPNVVDPFSEKNLDINLFKKKPWKAIILTIFLFLLGSILLSVGILIKLGFIAVDYEDRGIPLIILGSICFLPGFYHLIILIQIWRGKEGFTYNLLPEM